MRQAIKTLVLGIIRLLASQFGAVTRRRILRILREGLQVHGYDVAVTDIAVPDGSIRFCGMGDTAEWRANTALSKEPETLEWLNSVEKGGVLYDVGANIGVYTLYAAISRRMSVLAFEPLAANYYLLNRNIQENGLSDRVSAYCIALNDQKLADHFHVQETEFGSALSSFADPIDYQGNPFKAAFKQGMVGITLDQFIEEFDPPFPNHIKIDVDGIEDKIIRGAKQTISDNRLESISIELDSARPEYVAAVIKDIEAAGLKLVSRRRAPEFDGTPFKDIHNYLFRRAPSNVAEATATHD